MFERETGLSSLVREGGLSYGTRHSLTLPEYLKINIRYGNIKKKLQEQFRLERSYQVSEFERGSFAFKEKYNSYVSEDAYQTLILTDDSRYQKTIYCM